MDETLIQATNNDDCIELFPGYQNQNNASQEDTDRISEIRSDIHDEPNNDQNATVGDNQRNNIVPSRTTSKSNSNQEDPDKMNALNLVLMIQSDIHDEPNNDQNATVGDNQRNNIVPSRTASKSNSKQEDPDKMNANIEVAKIAANVGFASIIATALFAALCTLENQHVGSKKLILKFQDILHRNKWPSHFLLIVSLTIGFSVSWVVAVVSIWRMIMEKSFCYRALVIVSVCAFFSGYCFMLKEKVPNFAFGNIPGYWVVWLLGCSLVVLAIATLAVILEITRRIGTP